MYNLLSNEIKRIFNRENIFYFFLGFSALLGLFLMIANTYGHYEFISLDSKRNYRPNWEEYLMLPFYFTFLSNVLGLIISGIHLTMKNPKQIVLEHFKVMMVVNLVITFIVYWAILSTHMNWSDGFTVVSNLFIHLFTPIAAVVAFVAESVLKKPKLITVKKGVLWNFLMPAIYLIVALVLYAILGADGKEDAPYAFLDVANKPIMAVGYIIGIAVAYIGFTVLFVCIFKWNFKIKKN